MNRSVAIVIFLLAIVSAVHAQNADNTVSKNISKTILLQAGDVLTITGEKANINVMGWDKDYADLKIIFSAEHQNRKIALTELEYMHYSLSRDKSTVDLRNAFILPSSADRIQSRIKVMMQLMIPRAATFSLYNKYGDVELNDLSGKISLTLEFSDLHLNMISGKINIKSSYSEVRGSALASSTFTSTDEESKYILTLEKGVYSFNSKHGDLDLTLGSIQSLSVNATHTDITIQPANAARYNYQLTSKEGKIYVPQRWPTSVKKENNQSRFVLTQTPASPLIDIKTTFNTITIQ
jgi:hypothetical protein